MERLDWPLGRVFSFLTKQYIGRVSNQFHDTPVERYYFALYLIGKHDGKISQQELADLLLIDKVSLVRILDALTADGLIERIVNPNDRRQHILKATPKAEEWVNQIHNELQAQNDYFISLVDEEYRDGFIEGLKQLVCRAKDIPSDQIKLFLNKNYNNND